jgi:hypothetical protein
MNIKNTVAAVLFAAGAAVVGTVGPAAATAHADETTYLAIVYSPATGAYGWSNGSDTPANLYNTAMGYCQSYGGTDCRLLVDVVNGCGSLAVQIGHNDRYVTRNGSNRIQSDVRALSDVVPGKILLSRCSTGEEGIG